VTLIAGDHETDPESLVRKAHAQFRADNDYDAVLVLCDDDGLPLDAARQQARARLKNAAGKTVSIDVAASRPCFEFWLLLHFEYTTRVYGNSAQS